MHLNKWAYFLLFSLSLPAWADSEVKKEPNYTLSSSGLKLSNNCYVFVGVPDDPFASVDQIKKGQRKVSNISLLVDYYGIMGEKVSYFNKIIKLIDSGCNVNELQHIERVGLYTPLIQAILFGEKELVSLLLSKGANPDIKISREGKNKGSVTDGMNAYQLADLLSEERKSKNYLDIKDILEKFRTKAELPTVKVSDKPSSPDELAEFNYKAIEGLLTRDFYLGARFYDYEGCYVASSRLSGVPVVSYMLSISISAFLDDQDKKHEKIIYDAIEKSIDSGCDINELRKFHANRTTPLHEAILLGDAKLVALLLTKGANPDIKIFRENKTEKSLIEPESEMNAYEFADFLLNKKDSPNHKNRLEIKKILEKFRSTH